MKDHIVIISKDEQENAYFLESYLKGYNDENKLLTYKKSFKDYLFQVLIIDEPSIRDENMVIKIDNYWPREVTDLVSLIKKHSMDSYMNFDKIHNFLAFNGGDFKDCVFIDNPSCS